MMRLHDDHNEFLYEFRQRYEEMLAYQKELWEIAITNKQDTPLVSIKAIDSLNSITNNIACIIDVIPTVARLAVRGKQYPPLSRQCL